MLFPLLQFLKVVHSVSDRQRAADRGGGGVSGGQIAPGPQVLGAPRNFLLGPSHFFGRNISAQKVRYLVFWAK